MNKKVRRERHYKPIRHNIFRTLHPKTTKYTFFSSALGAFFMINNTLDYKINLNKFKRNKIIQSVIYNYEEMRSVIKGTKIRRKFEKFINI